VVARLDGGLIAGLNPVLARLLREFVAGRSGRPNDRLRE
jgi:hypothetical protein